MSDNGNAVTKRVRGTVKWFDERKYFGFIIQDSGGEGDSVEFEIAPGKDGRVKARNVTIVTKDDTRPSDTKEALETEMGK